MNDLVLPTIQQIQKYGWRKDRPDNRDWKLTIPASSMGAFPSAASLRSEFPDPYNQLQLGSCTGNAIAGVLEHQARRQGRDVGTPSRLFIYYQERRIEGTIGEDAGAEIRDGVKAVATIGCPPETDWPYSDANPGPFQGPVPALAAQPAQDNIYKGARYWKTTQDLWHIKWCITNHFPVVFGFTVFSPFESEQVASNGLVPLPQPGEQPIGGHAVVIVGYNDNRQLFEVRNSWGSEWGDKGYFWMPYSYLLDSSLANDLWTIRLVV